MHTSREGSAAVGAVWVTLLVAFFAVAAVWGTTLGQEFDSHHRASGPAAVPRFTVTGDATLAPPVFSVTVPQARALRQAACLFTQGSDGGTIVMSAATGSVLTSGQIKNCTK